MASRNNNWENDLIDIRTRSPEEQADFHRKGGIASGRARRERRMFKDEIAKRLKAKDFKEIVDNLIERAKSSDNSFEVLRDTMGEVIQKTLEISSENIIEINITSNDEDD